MRRCSSIADREATPGDVVDELPVAQEVPAKQTKNPLHLEVWATDHVPKLSLPVKPTNRISSG
jgi:hypothetical protein